MLGHAVADQRHVHVLDQATPLAVDEALKAADGAFHGLQGHGQLVVEPVREHADHGSRGELAALKTAHAVGDGDQRHIAHGSGGDLDQVAVLVGFARTADVGITGPFK